MFRISQISPKNDFFNLDIKMLLIIGAIVVVFFLVIYPKLKNEEEYMTDYTRDGGCKKIEKFENGMSEPEFNMYYNMSKENINYLMNNLTETQRNALMAKMNPSQIKMMKEKLGIKEHFAQKKEHFTTDEVNTYINAPVSEIKRLIYTMSDDNRKELSNILSKEQLNTIIGKLRHVDYNFNMGQGLLDDIFNNYINMPYHELVRVLEIMQPKDRLYFFANMTPKQTELMSIKLNNPEHMSDYVVASEFDAFGGLSQLDASNVDKYKLDTMMCSKSCCSSQWGVKPDADDRIQPNDLGTKYFSTNYNCDGENVGDKGQGCVCVTKDSFSYLGNRGGNNME